MKRSVKGKEGAIKGKTTVVLSRVRVERASWYFDL